MDAMERVFTGTPFKSVRNKLLESGKESIVVVAL
jgi:hypothetical protein